MTPLAARAFDTRSPLRQRKSWQTNSSNRWPWYYGILIYIAAQVASAGLNVLATYLRSGKAPSLKRAYGGNIRWSDTLKRPIFQPPNWLFPFAWSINNACEIYGALRVLNKPAATPGHSEYLALQAATGVDYALFSAGYFGLLAPGTSACAPRSTVSCSPPQWQSRYIVLLLIPARGPCAPPFVLGSP